MPSRDEFAYLVHPPGHTPAVPVATPPASDGRDVRQPFLRLVTMHASAGDLDEPGLRFYGRAVLSALGITLAASVVFVPWVVGILTLADAVPRLLGWA
jgi:hypothetical protein